MTKKIIKTVHYTMLGLNKAPWCADADGFIPYNDREITRIKAAIYQGKDTPDACLDGSMVVALANIAIDDFREQET